MDGVPCAGCGTHPAGWRDPRLHGARCSAALRAPGGWRALAGLWRALRRAAEEEVAAGARSGPRPLVGARRTGGARRRAPLVLTVHGTDAALLRDSRHRPPPGRPVFTRAQVVTRGLARAGRLGPERRWALRRARPRSSDARGQPVDWPWTTWRRRRHRRRPAHRRRSAIQPRRSRPSRSSRRADTIFRSPSSATAPSASALERQVERLGIARVRPLRGGRAARRGRRAIWPTRTDALPGPGRGIRSRGGRSADGRGAGGGLLGRGRGARRRPGDRAPDGSRCPRPRP